MSKIVKKVVRSIKQKSTWLGIGLLASILGFPEVGDKIGQVGQVVGLVVGGAAIAHDPGDPAE